MMGVFTERGFVAREGDKVQRVKQRINIKGHKKEMKTREEAWI